MAAQEYQVRVTAETKSASDKLDAVQNKLEFLLSKEHSIAVGVDAKALSRSLSQTAEVANNIRKTADITQNSSPWNVISNNSVNDAAKLYGTLKATQKIAQDLNVDFGKILPKSTASDILDTNKILEKLKKYGGPKTREIAEAYEDIKRIPGASKALDPIENFGRVQLWNTYGKEVANNIVSGVGQGIQQGVAKTKRFLYGELFEDIAVGANNTVNTLARVGLAIQGVQLLVGPLAQAWKAAFDSIIGQNVRLEQTILSTQTTLASTGRVVEKGTGIEVTDPLQKIQALEGGVRQAIDNIRLRSLELAGVTSSQIVDIFSVVATSIGQVGGDIKDAEDLAISFTAALGTLGVPFYQARQEIGSILGGYITEDSLLAKRLQISNQDIQKAKQSVDGVVGYLQKKLETAVAGQSIQAKGFAGVTSNIKEVIEVITQQVGQPLLAPLVGGLTVIYNVLRKIQGIVSQVGSFLAETVASTITYIYRTISSTKLAQALGAGLDRIAEPYERLQRAIQLGLKGSGTNLLKEWLNGLSDVPPVLQGMVNALVSLTNYLKLQLSLISAPLQKLIDQSRELLPGNTLQGMAQRGVRSIQSVIGAEGGQAFISGWDTLTSTIQQAGQVLGQFVVTLAKLKITQITASIRAAATVFELLGSVVLGRINLAIEVFRQFSNIIGSEAAQIVVSISSISKVISSTDFFGLKDLLLLVFGGTGVFKQALKDVRAFIQGFKDAGNIETYAQKVRDSWDKVFKLKAGSTDPLVAIKGQIGQLENQLKSLQAISAQMELGGAQTAALDRYSKKIDEVSKKLVESKKIEETISKNRSVRERATAALENVFGKSAEMGKAMAEYRAAAISAAGAGVRQAFEGLLTAVAGKLGMQVEQLKTLTGTYKVATEAVKQFMTAQLLINVGFTALSLGIAALLTWYQKKEEAERRQALIAQRTADVQRILASGWKSVIQAAQGGDINSQTRLAEEQSKAAEASRIAQEDKNKLLAQDLDINEKIFNSKQQIAKLAKTETKFGPLTDIIKEAQINNEIKLILMGIGEEEAKRLRIKKEIAAQEVKIQQALRAQQALQREESAVKDYEILSERRRDLEEKIKTIREDFEKEIADKAFQNRMEVLGIEQQKRKELQQQEINALQAQFAAIREGAGEGDQKIIQLAEEYQRLLLEAANNEGNRRAEYLQKEAQLRKSVEDYAFKMQRERLNFEKQYGAYIKQLEEYKNKQTQIRIERELAGARQREELLGVNYVPRNAEQTQQFVNATQTTSRPGGKSYAQEFGLTTADFYALFQLMTKDQLGVSGATDASIAIEKAAGELRNAGIKNRSQLVGELKKLYPKSSPAQFDELYNKLLTESVGVLNTRRFQNQTRTQDIAPPQLNIDYNSALKRMEGFTADLLDATRELNEALKAGDLEAQKRALANFAKPELFTGLKADYSSEIERNQQLVNNSLSALSEFRTGLTTVNDELALTEIAYRNNLRTQIRTNAAIAKLNLGEQLIETIVDQIIGGADVKSVFQKALDGVEAARAKPFLDATVAPITRLNEGVGKARDRVRTQTEARNYSEFQTELRQLVEKLGQDQITGRTQQLDAAFTRFNEVLGTAATSGYSLEKAVTAVRNQVESLKQQTLANLKGTPDESGLTAINLAFTEYETNLLKGVAALDEFNKAVESLDKKIKYAAQAADIYTNATKTLLNDIILNTRDLSSAVEAYSQTITQEFVSMFLDAVTAPMREQLFEFFKNTFGVQSAEEKARQALTNAQDALKRSNETLTTSVNRAISAVEANTAALSAPPIEAPAPSAAPLEAPATVPTRDLYSPENRAWMDMTRYAEGTWRGGSDEGYRVMFGGGLTNSLDRHPDSVIRRGGYASAAAGAYQFMPAIWKEAQQALNLQDFKPESQDLGFNFLAQRRGVDVNQPISRERVAQLAPEWASFPNMSGASQYNQPVVPYKELETFFNQRLAHYRSQGTGAGAQQQPLATTTNPLPVIEVSGNKLMSGTMASAAPPAPLTGSVTVPTQDYAAPYQATALPEIDFRAVSDFSTALHEQTATLFNWGQNLEFSVAGVDDLTNSISFTNSSLLKTGQDLQGAGTSIKQGLMPAIGGFTQMLAGIAGIVGGSQQMGKGGTYNTLMGLAGIFGGIAGVLSPFTPTGGLAGLFRAKGGPVKANRPYIVGEQGPELFTPDKSGDILSTQDTNSLFSGTRASLSQSRARMEQSQSAERGKDGPPQPIKVAYESKVINNVEYVTTDQLRSATKEAAERGRALAYQGLQGSVRVRQRLGL